MSRSKKSRRSGLAELPSAIETPRTDVRPPPTTLDEMQDQAALTEEMKIQAILDTEVGAGGKIYLQRRALNETDFRRLATIPVENFSLEQITNVYGGGDYKATCMTSKNKLVKNFSFGIDLSIPPRHPLMIVPKESGSDAVSLVKALRTDPAAAAALGAGGNNSMIPLVIAMMESSDRRFEAMMKANAERRGSGDDDFLKQYLLKKLDEKPTSTRELVETMQILRRLEGKPDGDEPEESPMDSLFTKLGKVLGPLVEGIVASKMGGQPAAPAALTHGAAAAGEQKVNHPQTEDPNMMDRIMINRFRQAAIKAAEEKKVAFEWVNVMFTMVPEEMHQRVFAMANDEAWFSKIFGNDVQAQKHIEFLTEVRHSILELAFVRLTLGAIPQLSPGDWAQKFMDWVSPVFHDRVADLVETPEAIAETFADQYEPNKTWLNTLGVEVMKQFDEPAPETTKGKK